MYRTAICSHPVSVQVSYDQYHCIYRSMYNSSSQFTQIWDFGCTSGFIVSRTELNLERQVHTNPFQWRLTPLHLHSFSNIYCSLWKVWHTLCINLIHKECMSEWQDICSYSFLFHPWLTCLDSLLEATIPMHVTMTLYPVHIIDPFLTISLSSCAHTPWAGRSCQF